MILWYILAAVIAFFVYAKWKHNYWTRMKIPQLKPEFIFGDSRKMLQKQEAFGELQRNRYRKVKEAGLKYMGTYFFLHPVLVPIDPALIKLIMQQDFQHFTGHGQYHHPKDVLSMNLFDADGDFWKNTRVKVSPTFTSGKLKIMFETLMDKTLCLKNVVNDYASSGDACDIKDVLSRFTTDVIGSCAFGIECNSLEQSENDFRKYGKEIFVQRLPRQILTFIFNWSLLANLGFKMHTSEVNKFFIDLVKNTIKMREEQNIVRKDFMHLMIQLKNRGVLSEDNKLTASDKHYVNKKDHLTVEEIIAQSFAFFAAGFETSATTMTFGILELSRNPHIQEKVRKEVNKVLEKYNGQMTYDAVMEMRYVENVVCETLRKYPPGPALPRICTKDYKFPDTDIVIKKGTRVDIPVWGLHMDPDFYPEPEKFDPERFNEENKLSRPDYTFLPFGEGPRMCIGMRFGMIQSKVGLATLIRDYKFSLNSKTKQPFCMDPNSLILSVQGEVWVNVSKIFS